MWERIESERERVKGEKQRENTPVTKKLKRQTPRKGNI